MLTVDVSGVTENKREIAEQRIRKHLSLFDGLDINVDVIIASDFERTVDGMGCAMIRKEVFQKTPEPWFSYRDMDPDLNEDLYFSKKARELGYQIKVRTDTRMSHIATTAIRTDTGALDMMRI